MLLCTLDAQCTLDPRGVWPADTVISPATIYNKRQDRIINNKRAVALHRLLCQISFCPFLFFVRSCNLDQKLF